MNNSEALLIAARTLIANKKDWTQGTEVYSLDSSIYDGADPRIDPLTCQFCSVGAVRFVGQGLGERTVDIALNRLDEAATQLYGRNKKALVKMGAWDALYDETEESLSAIDVNDSLGHKAVLKMFDKAIELAGNQRVR